MRIFRVYSRSSPVSVSLVPVMLARRSVLRLRRYPRWVLDRRSLLPSTFNRPNHHHQAAMLMAWQLGSALRSSRPSRSIKLRHLPPLASNSRFRVALSHRLPPTPKDRLDLPLHSLRPLLLLEDQANYRGPET